MFSRALRIESCADPGFFLVGGGGGGGGGGVRPDGQKTVWTFVFFKSSTYFTEGVQWFYRENYTFPRIQRGSNIFQGGPTFFFRGGGGGGGGVQTLISIETHPGGSGPPIPPLDPHMRIYMMSSWLNNYCFTL